MGQGYSLTSLSAGSAGIDIPELSDLVYEKSLGASRFMKSIRARHRDGYIAVKVIMKPYHGMDLDSYVRTLVREREVLSEMPNALGYHRIIETANAGYLARQYMHSSLYDRISTRPFLENIEKKWIAFQLLCALKDAHSRDVFHGDIKTENVLVTSWNWIYLTDFSSSYKPTFLPEDNPADFSFFFDTTGRRTCYLAPERFLAPGKDMGTRGVDWAMDIFSAGCVIAELFLETPIFTLSQLFRYRKGEHDFLQNNLAKIEDADVRELIVHMIRLDPESRYSADECLSFWRHKAFPEYFYSFLHQYMGFITDPASGRTRHDTEDNNYLALQADERIERIYHDFDKISYFLGDSPKTAANKYKGVSSALAIDPFPLESDLPIHVSSRGKSQPASEDGSLIFLTLVSSSLRNTRKASTRMKACDIFLAFAERLSDEAKMDRVLPYVVLLLSDPCDLVKVTAIQTLTQLLSTVQAVSPVHSCLFHDYIFPHLTPFISGVDHKPSAIVRATYASCIASLAHSSLRLLDMIQALRLDMRFQSHDENGAEITLKNDVFYHQQLYDTARLDLTELFEVHTKSLVTEEDVYVRRALLGSVPSLCVFFGNPKANEVILSHLNTYLNDRDWSLKCAFFEVVVGVAAYVGTYSLEEFILPLMVQSLTDPEDFVVERVFRSFASLANLGLLQPPTTWDLLDIAVRFFVHPNLWVREAAVHFVVASTKYASRADRYSIILPIITPFLRTKIIIISEANILSNIVKPIPKTVWEMAFTWASKSQKGVFWRSAARGTIFTTTKLDGQRGGSFGNRDVINICSTANEEDEYWLLRMRSIGLSREEEFKLLALREYIWKVMLRRSTSRDDSKDPEFYPVVSLSKHGITPQTVFFDKIQDASPPHPPKEKPARRRASDGKMHTIVDALLDASTTIDSGGTSRRRSARSRSNQRGENLPAADATRCQSLDYASTKRPDARPSALPQGNGTLDYRTNTIREDASDHRDRPGGPEEASKARSEAMSSRKHTAIHLLNRKDSSKTDPEISTTPMNALGRVDSQKLGEPYRASPLSMTLRLDGSEGECKPSYHTNHTYKGTDPTVLKLLDAVYLDSHPSDIAEFGPFVYSIDANRQLKRASGQSATKTWSPQGTLVALLGEHTGPVNRVAVSPDHAFFVTASDDGTVKIWDTGRLEKNLSPRSRQTHRHAPGARVKCLTFVANTHTIISAATDGSIHVVRVQSYHRSSDTVRYGKLELVRDYNISEHFSHFSDEHAVWLEQFRNDTNIVLLFATNRSRLIALDLKEMNPLYVLENPVNHGMVTTFCVDKKNNWVLVGTAHGILDLWDLRFQIRIKSWSISGGTPIHRLQVHPVRGMGRWVCVVGGTSNGSEVMIWDIDKVQCREVYRVEHPAAPTNKRIERGAIASPVRHTSVDMVWKRYEPRRVDEDPEGMLARFSNSSFNTTADYALPDNLTGPGRSVIVKRNGICALAVGLETVHVGDETYKGGFLITGGYDRKIRYWDVSYPEFSFVVGGEATKFSAGSDGPGLNFNVTTHLRVTTEKLTEFTVQEKQSTTRRGSKTDTSILHLNQDMKITAQPQQLLKRHLDAILDVAILKRPYTMIITVNRGGMIYIFQ
ncbi:Serine/threonine-protein kinase [Ascosphaera aggregata]|nr:Serine/threonine-protein kinase [Ascosphaera aggregata]